MDSGKILLLNLSKGRIGEDNAALLGAMIITKIQLAAMSRIDIAETERKDFFLYVDEFQNFATESFANILSEARKYRLDLTIAHQYIEQLDEKVQAAVFGNVGTIICFRVGAADAEFLAKEFFPTFTETDLVNLAKYDVYLKLMIDGVASEPFSAIGLPPAGQPDNLEETIIRVSRERYAKSREVVEDKISRWSGMTEMFAASAEEENRQVRAPGEAATERRAKEDMVVVDRQPVIVTPATEALSLSEALRTPPQTGGSRPDRQAWRESRRPRPRDRRRPQIQPQRMPPPAASNNQPPPTAPIPTPPRQPEHPSTQSSPATRHPLEPGQIIHLPDRRS